MHESKAGLGFEKADVVERDVEVGHGEINRMTSSRPSTIRYAEAVHGRGPGQIVSQNGDLEASKGLMSTLPVSKNQNGSADNTSDPVAVRSPLTPSWASDTGDDIPTMNLEGKDAEDMKDTPTAAVTGTNIEQLLLNFSSLSNEEVERVSKPVE